MSESVLFQGEPSDSSERALSRKSSMLERSRALEEDLVASLPPPSPLLPQSKVKRDLLLMCIPFSSTYWSVDTNDQDGFQRSMPLKEHLNLSHWLIKVSFL